MASLVLKLYDSKGDIHRTTINVPSLEEFTFGQLCEAVHNLVPDADLTRLKWEDPEKEQIVLRCDEHLKEAVRCMPIFSNGNHLKIHVVCVPQFDENRFVDVKVELLDDSSMAFAEASANQNGLVQSEAANKSLVNLPIMDVKAEPLDEPPENAIDDDGLVVCLSTDYLKESLISTAKKTAEKQLKPIAEESTQQEPVTRSTRKRHVADGIDAAAKDQSDHEKESEEKRSRRAEKFSDCAKDKNHGQDKAVIGCSAGTAGVSLPKPQIFIARGSPGQPQKVMITNVPKGTVVTKESIERLLGYLRNHQLLPQDAVQMAAVEQPTQPPAAAFANIGNLFVPGTVTPLPNGKHFVMRDRDGQVILLEKDAASGNLRSVCKLSEEFQERFGINRLLASAGVAGGSLSQATPQFVSTASSAVPSANVNTTAVLSNVSQVRETLAAEVSCVQKEWRDQLSQVSKLVKVFFPHPDLAKAQDESIRRAVVAYSRKEEKEMFEKADNKDEYYRLIAERIHKLQKLQTRLEQQQENVQPGDLLKCCTAGSSTLDGAPESSDET